MSSFFAVVLLIWTAMHVYVFWRVASIPALANVPRIGIASLALFLWASYVVGRLLARRAIGTFSTPLEWIGAHWLGVIFFLLVCLLAVDVITGFGFLLPRLAPTLRGWALAFAGVLSLIALVQGFRQPVVTKYDVHLPGLPAARQGTVLAVAADMHVGKMIGAKWLSRRVDQIEELHPDLIILAGDIVEGDSDSRELLPIFRRLSAPLGVFAVTGNHEFYAGVEPIVRFLQAAGIQVLRDRWIELQPGLVLAGIDDLTARRQYGRDDNFMQTALAARPNPSTTILISHTPWRVERARSLGVGLMLSAHTHGGQIWPFNFVTRTRYPFVSGRHDLNGMTLIVCRGTGTWGPRMRLWRRSEILRITLRG
jgi:predicted MPP superfamily phosphohydrolase